MSGLFFERKIRHLPNPLLSDSLSHLDHTLANDMILVFKNPALEKSKNVGRGNYKIV